MEDSEKIILLLLREKIVDRMQKSILKTTDEYKFLDYVYEEIYRAYHLGDK